jgi:hypothetical protein
MIIFHMPSDYLQELLEFVDECLISSKIERLFHIYVERLHGRNVVNNIYWHRIRSNPTRKSYHRTMNLLCK